MKTDRMEKAPEKENVTRLMLTIGLCTIFLVTAGWVMFFSTGLIFEGQPNYEHFNQLLFKRLLLTAGGILILGLFWLTSLKWIRNISLAGIMIGLILLGLVLWSPLGIEERGSRRWLNLWFMSFQPLEYVKIALLIFLADLMAIHFPLSKSKPAPLLIAGVVTIVMTFLVAIQQDLSGAALLLAIAFTMALVAGLHWKAVGLTIAGSSMLFISMFALSPEKLERFIQPIHSLRELEDIGYQNAMSIYAITNGGWFGTGAGSSLAKYSLPDHSTDFIFSIVCEEWGLVGGFVIIVMFAALVISSMLIAIRQKDIFRVLLGTGLSAMICYQAAIHVAVTTRWFPTTGQPLPFLSEGGSSFLMAMAGIGLMLNLGRSINEIPAEKSHGKQEPEKKQSVRKNIPPRPDFDRKFRLFEEEPAVKVKPRTKTGSTSSRRRAAR